MAGNAQPPTESAAWPGEMRNGAKRIRERTDVPPELAGAIAAHLEYAAGRLESKPAMVGPMTTGALHIARAC